MRNGIMEGNPVKQRMVWHDITEKNFRWNWEHSDGESATWPGIWKTNYQPRIKQKVAVDRSFLLPVYFAVLIFSLTCAARKMLLKNPL